MINSSTYTRTTNSSTKSQRYNRSQRSIIKNSVKSVKSTKLAKSAKSTKHKSYSPWINKKLVVHSLKTLRPQTLKLCDDLLTINIKINNNYVCKNYNDLSVKKILLYNLRASKHLNVQRFIPPIQLLSNCWFNTMYVSFFFSDKGRKFFRFFRELMIIGRKLDNSPLPSTIAKLFFILNLFIEASYNQTSKSHTFYNKITSLSNKMNTNYFIYHIYKILKNDPKSINPNILINNNNKMYDIPNIDEAGNPITYYEGILSYLNYNMLKFMKHKLVSKQPIAKLIQDSFNIPDIIIIEDFQSNTVFETNYDFVDQTNKTHNYVLDSIILTNKDHFDPKANSHFVSVLTINKKSYKYDGSSTSKLEPFNWKKLINSNKNWSFKENSKYEPEQYNFTKGYKILFYYKN
jgi:hypothetical protein